MIDFTRNHFELFGLPARFAVDAAALEARYRELQREAHPDRVAGRGDANASAGDAGVRLAMQASARVNEAYRTLSDPVARGRYLLALAGVDALDETDTSLPLDFLEAQLERREAAAAAQDAGDVDALSRMVDEVRDEARGREGALAAALDARDLGRARALVRELTFLGKVAQDVDAMIDVALDGAAG